ncbi:MAG: hypothetical protein MI700_05180, partial [Balneolales bacterium]|nr:hypothetical protein [Balneolales bacterium]
MLLLVTVGKVYAQNAPSPGQEIINQATVSYTDPSDGEVTLFSNPVEVVVTDNPVFEFWPNNAIKEFRGNNVELVHFIRNDGNITATYQLRGFNTTGDDFDMQDLSWTTQEVSKTATNALNTDTLSTQVTLEPGQQFEVGYIGWISEFEERDSLIAFMVFEATDLNSGITKVNVDTIGIRVGAIVEIQKSQIGAEDLRPEDSFQYLITGENVGDMTALPREIIIDGAVADKVILLDSIPANLSFTGFDTWDKGTPLYHSAGFEKYEFTTAPPEDLMSVDVIGLAFDSLQVRETFSLTFSVQVNASASGIITNIAELSYTDPEGDVTTAAASNEVAAEINSVSADIDYFTSQNFLEVTTTSSIGDSLHIQATASACNEDRNIIEIVDISIISELTMDEEGYQAVETGENTGVFRVLEPVPTRDGLQFDVVHGNGILETVEDDIIIATLICAGIQAGGGTAVEASVLVDPFGIVFDSETNEEIPGAEIRLIDVTGANNGGNAGGLAAVFLANGRSLTTNEQESNELGKYRYPFIRPGTYRLEVVAPQGYEFTSQVPVDSLPEGRNADELASYGMDFDVVGAAIGLDFDIPLDALANGVLMADKEVDQTQADIGDYVNYSITIKSASVNTLDSLTVTDELPFAFEYQLGSARLDGQQLPDPEGGKGPTLRFNLGSIEPGQTRTLKYRVYIGPGAERSDGINSAIVTSNQQIVRTSNEAKVKIEVTGGVFSDEAFIVGKVFLDCDENNMQDSSEPGIPGVRLYLENGNYVITDAEGKYSFYGIKANKHVLKLDNYSLPEGSKMKVLDNRHAFDPSSRFVDVTKGELHRADFAVCECTAEVNEEIERRKAAMSGNNDIVGNALSQNFSTNPNANRGAQARYGQASGTIGNAQAAATVQTTPGEEVQQAETSDELVPVEEAQLTIEEVLETTEPGTEILNVADGDTLSFDKVTLWAKGTNGALFDVFVNGIVVPANRIGQQSMSNATGQQIWEYVSIQLEPGKNSIILQEGDPFGNVRGTDEITVYVPGELAEIKVSVPVNDVSADGVSLATVRIEAVDEIGLPVGSRLPLMLDNEMGTWLVEDENAQEPGLQTFIEGGIAEFQIKAPIQPVTSKVRASIGDVFGEAKVEFLPDLRPLIAAGIIEGSIRLRDPLNIQSDVENDGFEEELKSLSYSMNSFTADGRFAFFLKGKVSGKTLLTAQFDSEAEDEERLFRDIRPEEYYPVYGDASIRGYDAQSSGRLYIRVDRNKTYALYGDFLTMENKADIQLGGYTRSQNGLKTHFEQGNVTVDAFGVSSVSSRRVSEFRGLGISRYELPDNELIDNSEIIELITYDRDQLLTTDTLGVPNDPSLIISRQRLTRFTDYTVDPFSGVITFRTPVSSVDSEFNPVFIRATYEVENNDKRYLVGGIAANVEVSNGVNVGGNLIQDNNPENEFTLAAGNLNAQLGQNTKVVAEVALTQNEIAGNGTAGRVEVSHRGDRFDVLSSFGRSSENFDNPGASLGQSRTEARLNSRFKIGTGTNLNTEFLLTRNDTTGDQTLGGLLTVQRKLGQSINAEVGVRYSDQSYSGSEDVTNTNLRSK